MADRTRDDHERGIAGSRYLRAEVGCTSDSVNGISREMQGMPHSRNSKRLFAHALQLPRDLERLESDNFVPCQHFIESFKRNAALHALPDLVDIAFQVLQCLDGT